MFIPQKLVFPTRPCVDSRSDKSRIAREYGLVERPMPIARPAPLSRENAALRAAHDHVRQDMGGELLVCNSNDAENPVQRNLVPLLTLDVWEHAYYVDYRNERARCVESFLDHLLQREFVATNLTLAPPANDEREMHGEATRRPMRAIANARPRSRGRRSAERWRAPTSRRWDLPIRVAPGSGPARVPERPARSMPSPRGGSRTGGRETPPPVEKARREPALRGSSLQGTRLPRFGLADHCATCQRG
jgi:Superoxide dismutase